MGAACTSASGAGRGVGRGRAAGVCWPPGAAGRCCGCSACRSRDCAGRGWACGCAGWGRTGRCCPPAARRADVQPRAAGHPDAPDEQAVVPPAAPDAAEPGARDAAAPPAAPDAVGPDARGAVLPAAPDAAGPGVRDAVPPAAPDAAVPGGGGQAVQLPDAAAGRCGRDESCSSRNSSSKFLK